MTQYPKVSHSFIRREILSLERQGVEVLRISVRGWRDPLVDQRDIQERDRTVYVLKAPVKLAASLLQIALRSPFRFLRALALALKMCRRADRSLPYHLVYLAEASWVVGQLRAHRSQHLHAHFGTNSAEVAMLAHVLSGIPYSFTAHGPDEFDMPQAIGLGEKIRRCAFVVAVSSFGRSQLVRWVEHEHWHKVVIVHCGLEPEFHEVTDISLPDRPRLVCVGRLSGQKGQLLLIEAASILARENIHFELVLAGDGELRSHIEAAIARHGIGDRVRITGWIGSGQVRDEIQAARALVLPSFAEGLPVVLMEAMALRRPVLTTYVAGIPELVIPGVNGWLFPAGSVTELMKAMKECLAMPVARLQEMGVQGRERALSRHDVDKESARLAMFFRQAACGPALKADTS